MKLQNEKEKQQKIFDTETQKNKTREVMCQIINTEQIYSL
jgi:hypothetical protein